LNRLFVLGQQLVTGDRADRLWGKDSLRTMTTTTSGFQTPKLWFQLEAASTVLLAETNGADVRLFSIGQGLVSSIAFFA
jgi:hypothetical protein